jgi:hypothetical protein
MKFYSADIEMLMSGWNTLYITTGIPGSVHHLGLSRDTQDQLTKLATSKPGEPTKILADKRYIAFREDSPLQLVTPHNKPAHEKLRPREARESYDIASVRVVMENFFGRLSTKFHIMIRRWGFEDEYYPTIFDTCRALVNFYIQNGLGGSLQKHESETHRKTLTHICSKGREAVKATAKRVAKRRARKQRIRDQQAQIDQEQGINPEDDERMARAAMESSDDSSYTPTLQTKHQRKSFP